MVRQSHAALIAFLLLSAPAPGGGQESTHVGEHFRVICHFENDRVATQALETAELVWPVATELLAVTDRAPGNPREIHLFRTDEQYEKVEAELAAGQFRENRVFSHWQTQASYILLQPDCSDEVLKRLGLPTLTRRLVAHEATHLVRYATMPNYRSHPEWLADGAASWVEQRVMAKGHWSPGAEDDPDMSTLIVRALALLEKGSMPSVALILQDRIDDVHWRTRYAIRWLLFRFLQKSLDRETFDAIMRKARQLGGGSAYASRLNAFVEGAISRKEMSAIDAKFNAYLRTLKPRWEEVYRSLETAGDDWTQIAFPDTNAITWRTAAAAKDEYTLKGQLRILPARKQQLNLLLGRNVEGFVSIALVAGSGVTAFEYHAKENRWERLGSADCDLLEPDRWIRFHAEIVGDHLRVILDSTPTLTVSLRGRSMRGPWGLGAQNASVGMWRNVTFE